MTSLLQCVSDLHTRQRLRSALSTDLVVPRTNRSNIGERSFQSVVASTWNALPRSVRSSTSVFQFIPAILQNLYLLTVTHYFCSVMLMLMTILILTNPPVFRAKFRKYWSIFEVRGPKTTKSKYTISLKYQHCTI